ncbi:TetR/AcrR family transcriptional regulator [Litorihabitans aurantiacus]|uniref:TetR family transcriptional regulator n=1 Tax=Litorihabitans aurantiacus TaxID=1930061 RepID=A0AA37UPP9_9MICO|nr:TetR/AcrR family transcriptional regulator [Litorihabitans aurantiacus]GMA30791.1 TetR family transcriptional regulator [Litorihabitans aurantiacus]
MTTTRGVGRPRVASRALLEEAACELFLEQGYAATSVAEVTMRAGVSRSTFFNYFDTKSDLLWTAFDEQVLALAARLRDCSQTDSPRADVERELRVFAADLGPDNVALAFAQESVMGLGEDLRLAAVRRLADVRDAVATHLRGRGATALAAEALGAALAGALLAAVRAWSLRGPGRVALPEVLQEALDGVRALD